MVKCIKCKKIHANFGVEKGKATHCKKCSTEDMRNVLTKRCVVCDLSPPFFSLKLGEAPTHCIKCATNNMLDVKTKKCHVCDLNERKYGIGKNPTHCQECATDDMKNLVDKLCLSCRKVTPTYGLKIGEKATHCSSCSTEDMFDVVHKMCETCHKIRPTHGIVHKKPTHCSGCATDEMKDVVTPVKKCFVCHTSNAHYGVEKNKPTHCSKCSLDGMKNVVKKMCRKCEQVTPTYGMIKGKIATHCSKCKTSEMFQIRILCQSCQKVQPTFGLPNTPATHCVKCASEDMVNVRGKMCEECDQKQASFGSELGNPTHCASCADESMFSAYKKCKTDWCHTSSRGTIYDSYCYRCFVNLFPDKPVAMAYKRKETEVANFIKSTFPTQLFVFDKQVNNGCSRRRPDAYLDLFTHVVIVETDENSHSNYNTTCDNKRTMELFTDFANRPIIFLRFNPDDYMNSKLNRRIPSPWKPSRNGVVLTKEGQDEWGLRLKLLGERIQFWIKNHPQKEVTVEHLF